MNNTELNEGKYLLKKILNSKIDAIANIRGGGEYISICGQVSFYDFDDGTVLVCVLHNLPQTDTDIFGFHIHEEGSCEGNFASAGPHYGGDVHPKHKGDLPVIFSNGGDAFMVVYTNRFTVSEVIGKSIILHSQPDDYTTQPAGNSGSRIACGIIEKC